MLRILLTVVFGLQVETFNITSNAKMLNIKVVRFVETNNFVFWVIAIRCSMQNLEPKYYQTWIFGSKLSFVAGGSPYHSLCLSLGAGKAQKRMDLVYFRPAAIKLSRWIQMKKW